MKADPFAIKKYPKWHPTRMAFTVWARLIEAEARWSFTRYALPEKIIANLPNIDRSAYPDSRLTSLAQMQHLLFGLSATEHLLDTVVVELGCALGGTTELLAKSTRRPVIAIDPYIGYGGSEADYQAFQVRTANLSNVKHERLTSGAAFRQWQYGAVGFVFIDALHDYVNTAFDLAAWSSLVVKDGILAMHDTDCLDFAGTRKAVFEVAQNYELIANPPGLTLLRKLA